MTFFSKKTDPSEDKTDPSETKLTPMIQAFGPYDRTVEMSPGNDLLITYSLGLRVRLFPVGMFQLNSKAY